MAMPDPVPGTLLHITTQTPGDRMTDLDNRTAVLEANAFARTSGALVTPDTFPALGEVMFNDAETTNGWGGVTLDATIFSQGTHSVSKKLRSDSGLFAAMIYNTPLPVTVGDYKTLTFNLRGASLNTPDPGGTLTWPECFDFIVADGFNLTGNTAVLPRLAMSELVWTTFELDISPLGTIRSVGLKGVRDSGLSGTPTNGFTWWIDYLRFRAQSATETALSRTPSVMVPASYAGTFNSHGSLAGHTLLDMRPSFQLLQRHANERDVREWDLPDDGSEDVTVRLGTIAKTLPAGSKLLLSPDGQYLSNTPIRFRGTDLELDAQGATIFTTIDRGLQDDHTMFAGGDGLTIRNLSLIGGRTLGINMVPSAGIAPGPTPFHLVNIGDEIMTDPAQVYYLARDKDGLMKIQAGLISQTQNVPNDCLIRMVDSVSGREMARMYPVLTTTPTSFTISVNGAAWLGSKPRVFITKVTSLANDISAGAGPKTLYSPVSYRGTHDQGAGFLITDGIGITLEDCRVEGIITDAVQSNTGTTEFLTIRRVQSIANNRQGMSLNNGRWYLVDDCIIRECGRTGLDFEPIAPKSAVQRQGVWHARVRGTTFINANNSAISHNQSSKLWYMHVEDCLSYNCGNGFMIGGAHKGVYRDIISFDGPTSAGDIGGFGQSFSGRDCVVDSITTHKQLELGGMGAVTFDYSVVTAADQDIKALGLVTFPDGGNTATNITTLGPAANSSVRMDNMPVVDVGARDASTSVPGGQYFGPFRPVGDVISALDPGKFGDLYPDTFKGLGFNSLWRPGGMNLLDDPLLNVRSLGGSMTKGNNFGRMGLVVPAGASTLTVAFPNPALGALSSGSGQPASVGGGTLAAGTYWVAVGARSRYGGPRTPTVYNSVTVGTNGAIRHTLKTGWDSTTELICGITWFRAGPSASPPSTYTTRYDWFAPTPFFGGRRTLGMTFQDAGAVLSCNNITIDQDGGVFGYPATAAAQSGSWTLANMTGNEPDTAYGIYLETSWPTDWTTTKRQNGFDIAFSDSPTNPETCGYLVWRA